MNKDLLIGQITSLLEDWWYKPTVEICGEQIHCYTKYDEHGITTCLKTFGICIEKLSKDYTIYDVNIICSNFRIDCNFYLLDIEYPNKFHNFDILEEKEILISSKTEVEEFKQHILDRIKYLNNNDIEHKNNSLEFYNEL